MKRLFLCILALIMLLGVFACTKEKSNENGGSAVPGSPTASAAAQQSPMPTIEADYLRIYAAGATANVGEEFDIVVSVQNPHKKSWCTFEFVMTYDPLIFDVLSIDATGIAASMQSMSNPAFKDNQIAVAFISINDYNSEGEIVVIKCRAIKDGVCELELSNIEMYYSDYSTTGEYNALPNKVDGLCGDVVIGNGGEAAAITPAPGTAQPQTTPVVSSDPNGIIEFISDDVTAKVGEEFVLTFSVKNPGRCSWCSIEATIIYNPALYEVVEFNSGETTKSMIFAANPDLAANKYCINFASLTDTTAEGTVFTVTCRALAEGTDVFTAESFACLRSVYDDAGVMTGTEPNNITIALGKVTITK